MIPTARLPLLALLILLLLVPSPALAEKADPTRDPFDVFAERYAARAHREQAAREAAARAAAAFESRDPAAAEAALRDQLAADPDSFAAHYNLACALAGLDRLEEAEQALRRSVELGFADPHQLERDPFLARLRDRPAYHDLLARWPDIQQAQRAARLRVAGSLAPGADPLALEHLRVDILSAHDQHDTTAAAADLDRVAAFLHTELFNTDQPEPDTPAFADPYAVIVLPDPGQFARWALWSFGPAARRGLSAIGGAYSHDDKRLVAQDLGATLRHEFFHVLHWRRMDRLAQRHPVWIQEGLASLVEDLDPPAGRGAWTPAPSWRTNIVKRLERLHRLPPLAELAALDQQRFASRRPLAQYAQARTLFLYLYKRDLLDNFYRVYTRDPDHGYAADPTGLAAITAVAESTLDRFEADYRDWIRDRLPEVPETGDDLPVTIGVELDRGAGLGPTVTKLPPGARARTGLRLADTITAVEGRPTRDLHELIRVLNSYRPGAEIVVSYRRGRLHETTTIPLLEK